MVNGIKDAVYLVNVAAEDMTPVISNFRNSWSNNFVAKEGYEGKRNTAEIIGAHVVDAFVTLHAGYNDESYEFVYGLVRPRIGHRLLFDSEKEVLCHIFKGSDRENITVDELEAQYLAQKPSYNTTKKRKRETAKAVGKELMKNLCARGPHGHDGNAQLESLLEEDFDTYLKSIDTRYKDAGLEAPDPAQRDCLLQAYMLKTIGLK